MMNRLLVAVVLLGSGGALARAEMVDVYLKDGKDFRDATLVGENVKGLVIQVGGKEQQIAAEDIEQVTYRLKAVAVLDFRRPFTTEGNALRARGEEKKKLLKDARDQFEDLDRKISLESANAHRYLRFKIAQTNYYLAQEDQSVRDAALASLEEYTTGFPEGWQVVPALKLQAALLEEKGDTAGAARAYQELTKIPGIPDTVKRRGEVLVAQLFIRSKQFSEAEAKLTALQKSIPADDAQRPFVSLYLAQSLIEQNKLAEVPNHLRGALKTSTDEKVRALAHNFLGDYYLKRNEEEKAFWEYLKVDMLYNQDTEQHAKALFHLTTLFDKVKNDPVRAREYVSKLQDKRFAETSYYQKVAPPPEK
jgi:hypothetical protein